MTVNVSLWNRPQTSATKNMLMSSHVQFTVTHSIWKESEAVTRREQWSEQSRRSTGSRRRCLNAESTQQTSHLQQGVHAFSHPHVSVSNLLERDSVPVNYLQSEILTLETLHVLLWSLRLHQQMDSVNTVSCMFWSHWSCLCDAARSVKLIFLITASLAQHTDFKPSRVEKQQIVCFFFI